MRTLPFLLLALVALPAEAKFHKFEIQEVFSNADGTVQFIEILGDDDDQHQITTHTMATNGSSFAMLTNLPSRLTDRRRVLFATQAFAELPGAPSPDYIIPANFINVSGDTIDWAEGSDELVHGALPTDGTTSINRVGSMQTNSPTNFAGTSGTIDANSVSAGICGDGMLDLDEDCDDGNTANGDCCSAACQFEVVGTACNDGNLCTTSDACDGTGTCAPGTPVICNDANACTQDACDPSAGCQHPALPAGTACNDGNLCTTSDACDGTGTCAPGTPVICNDANACTQDACSPIAGCQHPALPAGTACNDGNLCTTSDACDGTGTCDSGALLDCDDQDACTADGCDASGDCFHTPIEGCSAPPAVPLSTPLAQIITALVLTVAGAGGIARLRRR